MKSRWTACALALCLAASACSPPPVISPSDAADVADARDGALGDTTTDATDDASPTGLAAMLESVRSRNGLPALAALVADDNGILQQAAVGQRSVDDPAVVTNSDLWHRLVHEGDDRDVVRAPRRARVDALESTLEESFADSAATMNAAYRPVSVGLLFRHRAGVPAEIPSMVWTPLWMTRDVVAQRRTFAAAMLALAPAAPPNERDLYSNAGYMIAGAAIERATGRAWEELIRAEVFNPLGMTSCGFGAPGSADAVDQPRGHEESGGTLRPVVPGPRADNPPASGPAGTVHCSLADWARFARAHLRGAQGRADSYLSQASFTRMHSAMAGSNYGDGWIVAERPWAGGRALAHAGSNTMFLASVWIVPIRGRVLLVATNVANTAAESAVQEALRAMIDAYVPTS